MNRLLSLLLLAAPAFAAPPQVGEKAPDFSLSTPEGKVVKLSEAVAEAPVVLVVLRGFPGYTCPYCVRQVQDFVKNQQGFADAGVKVILVYPGPPADLGAKAEAFVADKNMPKSFDLVLDPGYEFTNLYGIRWDAPNETAYPSTFLIDKKGIVFFSRIVKSHAARSTAAEILDALPKKPASR
jgi:peroxiredoxin